MKKTRTLKTFFRASKLTGRSTGEPAAAAGRRLREVCAEVDGARAVVDADLHVVVPHAVHDHALEAEGVGEGGQLEEAGEADALVNLG